MNSTPDGRVERTSGSAVSRVPRRFRAIALLILAAAGIGLVALWVAPSGESGA
jgi:hypothetical protein